MEKSINYTARDFEDIKNELIGFSNKYYPSMTTNFNDSSVGAWFIDLVSAVGDDLNYYIDRCYQENNVNSANQMSSVMNIARMNGVKVPGPKASVCEVRLSCSLSVDSTNIEMPNWDYAPIVKRGSIVGSGSYKFELNEDVNFGEQFNSNGISNRTFTPKRNTNGIITGYTVTKTALAVGGMSKVYKKVMIDTEVQPFMEVIIPSSNVMEVESIIFKETANFDGAPMSYEYFIDEEEFIIPNQSVKTYRYFEVNSLSDQYRFGGETRYANDRVYDGTQNMYVADEYNPQTYYDYTETTENGVVRSSRYFKGVWKPITQKFITEYTDNGYLKIIFGGATTAEETPEGSSTFGEYITSKIINNDMLGVMPKVGWTMFVYYRSGEGKDTNLGVGAINSVISANMIFPSVNAKDTNLMNSVRNSLTVVNTSPSVCGKDFPSATEVKYLTKYSVGSQERCVTLKDYKARVMQIPPKFGCPYRCNAIEDNNKIVLATLGLNANGKLDSSLPNIMAQNLVEYLKHYKNLTDYVEVRSGRIYHLGFEIDAFIDKNYTSADVVAKIMSTIKEYFNTDNHDMGEDIFVGDLERELNGIDGVISLIDLRVYNIYGGGYSRDKSPMPKYIEYTNSCGATEFEMYNTPQGSRSYRISLKDTDNILYGEYDSMFEILNPSTDIQVRFKLK